MKTFKQFFLGLSVALVFFAILGGIKAFQISQAIANSASFQPPADLVEITEIASQNWPRVIRSVGSLSPVNGVALGIESAGVVNKISFESGQEVKKGDTLVTLDSSVEEAQLRGAQARLDQALRDLDRMRSLRARNSMSISDLELAQSNAAQERASVEALKATIERRKVVAPFDGITGIRRVNVGEYVSVGSEIVPLHSLENFFLNFSLAEQYLNNVQIGQKVVFNVDGLGGKDFSGLVDSLNPNIDVATRTFAVQAFISNGERLLRSGMFASVRVFLSDERSVLAIPAGSVLYAPYGDSIYQVVSKKKDDGSEMFVANPITVKLGERRGDEVEVISGLEKGMKIVKSGVFKLRPGVEVKVAPEKEPSANNQGPRVLPET